MKQLFTILLLLISGLSYAQELTVSTMKMGPFSLKMNHIEAEKIAGRKLIIPTEQNDYNGESNVIYQGEQIKIQLTNNYFEANAPENSYAIYSLSTSSKKFKTKSGLGVGNTRSDLINTYRDYPNFSVYQGWNDNGEKDASLSYFSIEDLDASTTILFKMVNNVVVEISIHFSEGGC